MNELALFAGAGGGILGGKILGWKTVCAVEWDGYARDVLVARQNDGSLDPFPIWDDVQTFDGLPWRGSVDVVSGGFPCQDISSAGRGEGIDGKRSSMWSHMARIIGEVRPRFVFVENSPLLVGRGLTRVLGNLAEMGYDAEWGVLGAHHASAPHKRDRIWIVGHSNGHGEPDMPEYAEMEGLRGDLSDDPSQRWGTRRTGRPDTSGKGERKQPLQLVGDTLGSGLEGYAGNVHHGHKPGWNGENPTGPVGPAGLSQGAMADADRFNGRAGTGRQDGEKVGHGGRWRPEPAVGRVANGVACRMDRLRCIGNGQVPRVAAMAWRILRENDRKDAAS